MTELAIKAKTYIQFKTMADQKKSSVEELAEQVIREYLRREARKIMQQEINAYQAMHDELQLKYLNQYVAIHQGEVIDHDVDELALYLRLDQKYPDVTILLRQVKPQIEEIITVRSPRFEHV